MREQARDWDLIGRKMRNRGFRNWTVFANERLAEQGLRARVESNPTIAMHVIHVYCQKFVGGVNYPIFTARIPFDLNSGQVVMRTGEQFPCLNSKTRAVTAAFIHTEIQALKANIPAPFLASNFNEQLKAFTVDFSGF